MALSAAATSLGGSPGRRGFSTAGIFLPVTFSHIWMTCADGVAVAVAQIVKALLARSEGEDVRLREVNDVDVIADAGAVGRGIIGAVNFALCGLAKRDLEDVGDEMSFDAVMFAEFFAGAGGVEIAEGDEFEPVNLVIPVQHLLEHQFGFAVGIDGALREVLGHGDAVGRAVGGAGGAEDEFFHSRHSTAASRSLRPLQTLL